MKMNFSRLYILKTRQLSHIVNMVELDNSKLSYFLEQKQSRKSEEVNSNFHVVFK